MIIHANVTIPKNMVAQIGSNAAIVQIVRRVLRVRRDRLVQEVQLAHRAFLESEVL